MNQAAAFGSKRPCGVVLASHYAVAMHGNGACCSALLLAVGCRRGPVSYNLYGIGGSRLGPGNKLPLATEMKRAAVHLPLIYSMFGTAHLP